MKKVLLFSILLIAGLALSQLTSSYGLPIIKLLTMFALSFIMIHVGYEFEIDKSRPRKYAWDYLIAGTAATFPWIFAAGYFVFVMAPAELWGNADLWKESLLIGRFASPTSAGVLFSMLAAAGLSATWMFKKVKVLAIFDDLDTVLLLIPLKIMIIGLKWQLGVIVIAIVVLIWLAWKYLHRLRLPVSWPFVMLYSGLITAASELIYMGSKLISHEVPIHLEVLLPAFVLGCMLARPVGHDPHSDDSRDGHQEGPESKGEQRVATIISAAFMILVGLSMPPILGQVPVATEQADSALFPQAYEEYVQPEQPATTKAVLAYDGVPADILERKEAFPGWGMIAFHVLLITVLVNLGKMFPTLVYRKEASIRERLAISVGMCPRGEVGAGVLVISLSYGLSGPIVTVAVLSLALNLLLTGVFIIIIKRLLDIK
jgi:Kef-type K+ transport system membrane component KefB